MLVCLFIFVKLLLFSSTSYESLVYLFSCVGFSSFVGLCVCRFFFFCAYACALFLVLACFESNELNVMPC